MTLRAEIAKTIDRDGYPHPTVAHLRRFVGERGLGAALRALASFEPREVPTDARGTLMAVTRDLVERWLRPGDRRAAAMVLPYPLSAALCHAVGLERREVREQPSGQQIAARRKKRERETQQGGAA